MIRILIALLILVLVRCGGISAEPAAERLAVLQRGINLTNWFRYPASREPAALRGYFGNAAMKDLRRSGFTFVRLPVQPELLDAPGVADALSDAVARLERQGLAVIVVVHPSSWHLEADRRDRGALAATWASLAPMLRRFDPAMTFPELLNEPVFADAPGAWEVLQHQMLTEVRGSLPANTVILTGANWGSVNGLLALLPEPDPNVVYSVHLYEPAELTALGAYHPGLDAAAMARLPFPVLDKAACEAVAKTTIDAATADLMRFYCAEGWDGPKLTAKIAAAAAWAQHNHASILVGEFGASQRLNAAARLTWIETVRTVCEQQKIGWALWGYDDSMGFGLRLPRESGHFSPAMLRALGLAAPMLDK